MTETIEVGLPQDHEAKDQTLKTALDWFSRNNITYIPLNVEEDLESSYAEDSPAEFEKNVGGWMRELVEAEKRRRV